MNQSLKIFWREILELFNAPLFVSGEETISLAWLFQLLLWLLIVAFVTRLIKRFLKFRLLARLGIDPGNREALAALISYTIGVIASIAIVHSSGFDLATFAVIIGGLGVGIGFGLQDITKNLVSGITLLIERKLKVGDFIKFEDISGYIQEISIRTVVVRTLAGEEVIVPNSQLVENKITNKSYGDFTGRISLPIDIAYGSNPIIVTEVLLNAAHTESEVLAQPSPKVIFRGFGESALNFELWVWVKQIDREIPIKSSLYFKLEYNLRAANISIPFPQRDIWLKNPEQISSTVNAESFPEQPNSTSSLSKPLFLQNLLRQVSYFKSLNEIQMRELIELGYRKNLKQSEILYHQGDPGHSFCLVVKGAINALYQTETSIKSPESEEILLVTFNEGQFFGELPLMLGIPYPTTMQAVLETIVFMVDAHNFGELLRTYPALEEEIVRELSKRRELLAEHQKTFNIANETDADSNLVIWIHKRLKQLFNF